MGRLLPRVHTRAHTRGVSRLPLSDGAARRAPCSLALLLLAPRQRDSEKKMRRDSLGFASTVALGLDDEPLPVPMRRASKRAKFAKLQEMEPPMDDRSTNEIEDGVDGEEGEEGEEGDAAEENMDLDRPYSRLPLIACVAVTAVVFVALLIGISAGSGGKHFVQPSSTSDDARESHPLHDTYHGYSSTLLAAQHHSSLPLPPPLLPQIMPPPSPRPLPPPQSPGMPPCSPPFSPSPQPAPPPAPPPEVAVYVSILPAPFAEARAICERQLGTLMVPRSDDANAALVAQLATSTNDRMWLGTSDAAIEGSWERREAGSMDGVPLSYTNWAPGQPDGGAGENCAEMWSNGQWNDMPCSDSKTFACEVPQPPAEGFEFACNSNPAATRCVLRLFGADGVRPSEHKSDFAACRQQCEGLAGRVAEPRTAEQLQYLARALRRSGDDSMWIGVRPIHPYRLADGWKWLSNDVRVTADRGSWAHGQPDNDGQCVELWGDATWNDRGCSGDFWSNKVCPCELPAD